MSALIDLLADLVVDLLEAWWDHRRAKRQAKRGQRP
jgi:hypothetical protein